jgi:hypothetical protein
VMGGDRKECEADEDALKSCNRVFVRVAIRKGRARGMEWTNCTCNRLEAKANSSRRVGRGRGG